MADKSSPSASAIKRRAVPVSPPVRAPEPIPGQLQMLGVQEEMPSRVHAGIQGGKVPRYEDVVLTAEQVEQALARPDWQQKPVYARGTAGKRVKDSDGNWVVDRYVDTTEHERLHRMKMKVWQAWRHSIVVDEKTGQRAFGGPQHYKTNEQKRIDQRLIEAADARGQEIIDAAFSALHKDNPPEVRHRAAMNLSKEAREIRKVELQEDALERASASEVTLQASEILAQMVRSGEIDISDLAGMVDGTATEIPPDDDDEGDDPLLLAG